MGHESLHAASTFKKRTAIPVRGEGYQPAVRNPEPSVLNILHLLESLLVALEVLDQLLCGKPPILICVHGVEDVLDALPHQGLRPHAVCNWQIEIVDAADHGLPIAAMLHHLVEVLDGPHEISTQRDCSNHATPEEPHHRLAADKLLCQVGVDSLEKQPQPLLFPVGIDAEAEVLLQVRDVHANRGLPVRKPRVDDLPHRRTRRHREGPDIDGWHTRIDDLYWQAHEQEPEAVPHHPSLGEAAEPADGAQLQAPRATEAS
mmetsp:Transcript_127148/g.283447  ORF Transcript_127148/g.283447 Transcript_127148/m.283447 type:complete len:260 (+) Transcript_127148:36-815(+)